MQRGRAGQDGGAGVQEARQCRTTVPEEQRVPGQQAGAEVGLTNQQGDLGGGSVGHKLAQFKVCTLQSVRPLFLSSPSKDATTAAVPVTYDLKP